MDPMTQRRIIVVPGRLERHIAHCWEEAHAEQRRRIKAATEEAQAEAERAREAARAAEEAARLARCPRPDKVAWGTREGAQDGVHVMRSRRQDPDLTLVAYRCSCGGWHIGNDRSGRATIGPRVPP